ncbi:MAG TPA: hypothetical protein VKA36_04430 [Solirubrobacterales bacterium]|nr:hypothetical protein [Solirubrobacterales bacterium]
MATTNEITIRMLTHEDLEAVRRVAERDSAPMPRLPLLGAESDGRLLAALGLGAGNPSAVADPFMRTAQAQRLLELRARQLLGAVGAQASSSGAMVRPAEASCSQ